MWLGKYCIYDTMRTINSIIHEKAGSCIQVYIYCIFSGVDWVRGS